MNFPWSKDREQTKTYFTSAFFIWILSARWIFNITNEQNINIHVHTHWLRCSHAFCLFVLHLLMVHSLVLLSIYKFLFIWNRINHFGYSILSLYQAHCPSLNRCRLYIFSLIYSQTKFSSVCFFVRHLVSRNDILIQIQWPGIEKNGGSKCRCWRIV